MSSIFNNSQKKAYDNYTYGQLQGDTKPTATTDSTILGLTNDIGALKRKAAAGQTGIDQTITTAAQNSANIVSGIVTAEKAAKAAQAAQTGAQAAQAGSAASSAMSSAIGAGAGIAGTAISSILGNQVNKSYDNDYADMYYGDSQSNFMGGLIGRKKRQNAIKDAIESNTFSSNAQNMEDAIRDIQNIRYESHMDKRSFGQQMMDNIAESGRGAALGSAAGPYGALIGGVAAAIGNWIGKIGEGKRRREYNRTVDKVNEQNQVQANQVVRNALAFENKKRMEQAFN